MEHIRINNNLRLETVKLSMASEIFSAIDHDREYLKTWLPFIDATKKVSDTELFLKSIINQPTKNRDEVYCIWHKEEFAGLIGYKDTDWTNQKTELGYWLTKKMQGKGIAIQCVQKLIRYAFKKLNMNRIQVKVAVGNTKSAAIPQKLNFTFEGIERNGELHGQIFLDLEIYSLLKSDLFL